MPSSLASRVNLRVGIVAEALGKSPACGSLRRGSRGGSPGQRLYPQPLRARQIPLLHALLALELAFLPLQQPLLRTLRPQALVLRLLRLQLPHALLQPIDAVLTLHALARKDVALAPTGRAVRLTSLTRNEIPEHLQARWVRLASSPQGCDRCMPRAGRSSQARTG